MGDVYFDEAFDEIALVNVVALGLVKENEIIHSRAPEGSAGWDIVLVGKATDRSGFGGASFSSLVLDAEDKDANKSAVQVPDPFLKNVIMRASYRVSDLLRSEGIEAGFKDLGGGRHRRLYGRARGRGRLRCHRRSRSRADSPDPTFRRRSLRSAKPQERLCWILPPSVTPRVLAIYNEEFSLPMVPRGARAAVIGDRYRW